MPHFSSPAKAFAPREPVALTQRDSAPESCCTPLTLPSSFALLPLHPPPLPPPSSQVGKRPLLRQAAACCPLAAVRPRGEPGAGPMAVLMVPAPAVVGPGICMCLTIIGTVAFPSGPCCVPHLHLSPACPGRLLALCYLHSRLCWGLKNPFLPPHPFPKVSSFTLLPPALLFPMPFPVLHLCRVFFSLSFS